MSSGALEVLVDGVKLPDEEARAMWARFSAWMDEHKGDLAGFATSEGFVSVKPAMSGGRPVLLASVREAQVAYANAREIGAPKGARGAGKPKR